MVVSTIVNFYLFLGEMIRFDEHIFSTGLDTATEDRKRYIMPCVHPSDVYTVSTKTGTLERCSTAVKTQHIPQRIDVQYIYLHLA